MRRHCAYCTLLQQGPLVVWLQLQYIYCGKKATLTIGNVKPVGDMPEGTIVCNVEEKAGELGRWAWLGLAGEERWLRGQALFAWIDLSLGSDSMDRMAMLLEGLLPLSH